MGKAWIGTLLIASCASAAPIPKETRDPLNGESRVYWGGVPFDYTFRPDGTYEARTGERVSFFGEYVRNGNVIEMYERSPYAGSSVTVYQLLRVGRKEWKSNTGTLVRFE